MENKLIALQPNKFETIQQLFSKFKYLVMQCKQCEIDKKYEQLVLSILSKLGSELLVFVSIFQSGRCYHIYCSRATIFYFLDSSTLFKPVPIHMRC